MNEKLLFVHTIKTGGTAVEDAFARSGLKKNNTNGISAKVHSIFGDVRGLGKHAHAAEYLARLGQEEFSRYHSVGFIRNPWDWLVSFYEFVRHTTTSPDTSRPWRHALHPVLSRLSFEDYIHWVVSDGLQLLPSKKKAALRRKSPTVQLDWLCDAHGNKLVTQIGKYEELEEEYKSIGEKLGLNLSPLLRINASKKVRHYTEYYTKKSADRVQRYFEPDVSFFEYEFK